MSENKKKVFEDWEEVNCNECARYWDSSCDGVPVKKRKMCNSYLAKRDVVIPQQIKKLQKDVAWLYIACGISNIAMVILLVMLMV